MVWDGCEPCSSGAQAIHLFFDFWGGLGHEGGLEGLIAFLLHFAVGGACSAYAAAVGFEAEGFIGEEGVDKGLGGGGGTPKKGICSLDCVLNGEAALFLPRERRRSRSLFMGPSWPRTMGSNWVARRGPMSETV